MCVFKNSLVVFGGAGQYLKKLKKRETFNDVWLHKPLASPECPKPAPKSIIKQGNQKELPQEREPVWEELNAANKAAHQNNMSYVNGELVAPRRRNLEAGNIGVPTKRMGHAAAILGNILLVHGGIYGEENQILDDF